MTTGGFAIRLTKPAGAEWRALLELSDVDRATTTLDFPPSLILVRLRAGVTAARAEELAQLFREALESGTVTVESGGPGRR